MKTFLQQVAEHIKVNQAADTGRLTIVLPSQRASVFLKKELHLQFEKTFLLPAVITINEFIEQNSEYIFARNAELVMYLYEAYRTVEKEEAESFDRFVKWGGIMISDFSEIDRYMIDPEKILSDLSSIKEIENWSFSGEELTGIQKNYLRFWNRLPEYYREFNKLLDENKISYQGKLYKQFACRVDKLFENKGDEKMIFAGFSALSVSEEKILFSLKKSGIAELFFDADEYYTLNKGHEAGLFMRKIFGQAGNFNRMENYYKQQKKNIKVYGAPGNIQMAAVAGKILQAIADHEPLTGTALVLADEQLLLPVLNSIPENAGKVNVTMGLPLKFTEYISLVHLVSGFYDTELNEEGETYFYHVSVTEFYTHPIVQKFCDNKKTEKFLQYINDNNLSYVPVSLMPFPWENEKWKEIFTSCPGPANFTRALSVLNDLFAERLYGKEENFPLLEQVYLFSSVVNDLARLLKKFPYISERKTIRSLIRQYISNEKISFYGEPLEGLQLMGMLETRALDFSTVVLLSVNENKLPHTVFDNSFIPSDVKRLYGLPGKEEKEAVYAYHFYRLLQRASDIHLVYNNNTELLGNAEKSRFALQLQNELPLFNPASRIETLSVLPSSVIGRHEIKNVIPDDLIREKIENLFASGISPSAINCYLNCPLDFYYKYILGIREEEEILDAADSALAGTIIHSCLEKLYQPFAGKKLTIKDADGLREKLEKTLSLSFAEQFGGSIRIIGKNRLIYEASLRYISNFLENEKKQLEESGFLEILALESSLQRECNLEKTGVKILFKGKADRIDKLGDNVRIMDYKTGFVDEQELQPGSLEEITAGRKYGKALQLMMYAWMFSSSYKGKEKIVPCLAAVRAIKNPVHTLSINNSEGIDIADQDEFGKKMLQLALEIYSGTNTISHNSESKYCLYCER